jgi:ABC-type nickel/cobalt efflux system permease component RcnA
VLGEVALGGLLALTFCPVSAALFFGSLLPQALAGPAVAPPVVAYGIGTAIPVAVFALGVVFSAGFAARFGAGITRWQPKIKLGTGVVLLGLGLYLIGRDTALVGGARDVDHDIGHHRVPHFVAKCFAPRTARAASRRAR